MARAGQTMSPTDKRKGFMSFLLRGAPATGFETRRI